MGVAHLPAPHMPSSLQKRRQVLIDGLPAPQEKSKHCEPGWHSSLRAHSSPGFLVPAMVHMPAGGSFLRQARKQVPPLQAVGLTGSQGGPASASTPPSGLEPLGPPSPGGTAPRSTRTVTLVVPSLTMSANPAP